LQQEAENIQQEQDACPIEVCEETLQQTFSISSVTLQEKSLGLRRALSSDYTDYSALDEVE
jgi:hypothetical protein